MSETNNIYLINGEFNNDKKNFIKRLSCSVKNIKDMGFAGYDNRRDLEKNLEWQVFDEGVIDKNFSFNEGKIKELIEETLNKCLKEINRKPHIFVFPSYNKFTNEKMGGVGGNSSKYLVMLIFINTSIKKWEKNLKETVCHEFAHAISPYYNPWKNTIGEGIIFDGIAENFQEYVLKGRKSTFSNILAEDECRRIFVEITEKLSSKNQEEYNELFYGGGKYKHWTGYALGYWLVKKYLKTLEKVNWESIINTNPNEMLSEIKKIL